jgi:DNA-binding winged helix-turn-helix (wHTH) protein
MPPADSTNPKTVRESLDIGAGMRRSAIRNVKHRGIKAKRVIIISSDSEEEEKEASVSFPLSQFLRHIYDLF